MDKEIDRFVAVLKDIFSKKLQYKTGWGRNELWMVFNMSLSEALLEIEQQKASDPVEKKKPEDEEAPIW